MELDAAKRCFSHLKQAGLKVDVFVSDRHKGIGKWIWTEEQETQHFNDIWHVNKGINKVLRKTSKEKGCEIIGEWTKGIRNHLYWCVQSTQLGFGELIVAKWQSTVRHIANKHIGHSNMLFPNCNHGELEPRRWIQMGDGILIFTSDIFFFFEKDFKPLSLSTFMV